MIPNEVRISLLTVYCFGTIRLQFLLASISFLIGSLFFNGQGVVQKSNSRLYNGCFFLLLLSFILDEKVKASAIGNMPPFIGKVLIRLKLLKESLLIFFRDIIVSLQTKFETNTNLT